MSALESLEKDTRKRRLLDGRRDGLIVAARREGATWAAISQAAGLTELACRNAAKRANAGVLPVPRSTDPATA